MSKKIVRRAERVKAKLDKALTDLALSDPELEEEENGLSMHLNDAYDSIEDAIRRIDDWLKRQS